MRYVLSKKALDLLSVVLPRIRPSPTKTAEAERAKAIAPFFDASHWERRYPRSASLDAAVSLHLRQGDRCVYDPHPLFDTAFYRSQLAGRPKVARTLMEHYVEAGAAARLDPSPLFSTGRYVDRYPDIKSAGVNPLLHFVNWGVFEGRLPLPIDACDLGPRVEFVLGKDPFNPFGLAYRALCLAKARRHQEAAVALESARPVLPEAFYLKIVAVCLVLARRTDEAEEALSRSSRLPGVFPGKNDLHDILVWGVQVAEQGGDVETAILLGQLVLERGLAQPESMLYRLASLHMQAGKIDACGRLLAKAGERDYASDPRVLEVVSVKRHCRMHGTPYIELFAERPIDGVQLLFLDSVPALTSQPGSLTAPPFYMASVEECTAFSRCNLLVRENELIYDLALADGNGIAALGDTVSGLPLVQARHINRALLAFPRLPRFEFECGLMMFGVQSSNYGHWFLEFLPRMVAYEDERCGEDSAIIVDANMPRSHLELLQLLNVRKRQVIQLAPDTAVRFGRLGVAPVPAFFPLDVVKGAVYDTVWPRDIFGELKRLIVRGIDRENPRRGERGRRLFVSRRKYPSRQLLNEEEIEAHLSRYGFKTISPETLTIREQIDAFRSASIVVGSCSSALTNAIFCEPGAKVVGLIHDGRDFNFRGYASFIEAGGARIMFVQGVSAAQADVHSLHRNYKVSLGQVSRAIDWAMA